MKTRFTISLFVLLSAASLNAYAQTKISGKVSDKKGQPIPGASVFIKDSYDGTSADASGNFSFVTEEKGEQVLSASFIGYEAEEKKINLEGKEINITISLNEKVTELNTVTISAGAFEASDEKKMVMLRPLDIVTTAGAAGDLYGAIQTLPGTQATSNETGLFVRGGDATETKTLIDGVVVANPYFSDVPDVPQRGRFSPFLFKGTNFSTGGYSAQYGQAMSSALILESQDIADKTVSSINVMTVGGGLGHTHRWKRTSLGVFGNYINLRPYYALVKQNRDWGSPPESASGSLIFRQQTSKTGLLKAFVNYSYSDLSINYANLNDTTGESVNPFSLINNNLFADVSYKEIIAKKWTLNSGFSYSNNNDHINQFGNKIKNYSDLIQGRIAFSHQLGNLSVVRFGGEAQHANYRIHFNEYPYNSNETYFAGFAEGDVYITNKLVSRIGARAEHSEILNDFNIAPRVSVAYKTNDNEQFSVAYGDFYQVPESRYFHATGNLGFQKATHYILNWQHLDDKRTFRIEGYYKDYDHLLSFTSDTNSSGYGFAKGIDVFWRDKKTLKYGDYWISYSYLDSKRKYLNYPVSAVPPFAAKHTLSVVFKYFIPKISLSCGVTYVFATGRSYVNPNNTEFLSDKTKNYNNLSLNFSYLTSIGKHFTVIAASVGNILGINNVFDYNYSNDGMRREAVGPPALRSFFVGMFISIGEIKDDDL